jgi:exosortase
MSRNFLKDKTALFPFIFLLVLVCIIYYRTLIWVFSECLQRTEYSHGLLIPFITFYLIKNKWSKLNTYNISNSKIVLFLICVNFIIQIICIRGQIYFLSGWSMVLMLLLLTWYFFGKETMKRLSFPFFFLLFMIPLPSFFLNPVTYPLKECVTWVVCKLLELLNPTIYKEGTIINLTTGTFVIDNPCSGINSLLSFITFGSLFAHLISHSLVKKLLMIFISVFLALVLNIFRVTGISLVAEYIDFDKATGIYHDISGYVFITLGILLIYYVWNKLSWKYYVQGNT